MTLFSFVKYLALLTLLVSPGMSFSENHALLIGISNYPVIKPLEGPVNDVALVKSSLLDHWQFGDSNIATLVDKQATKKRAYCLRLTVF